MRITSREVPGQIDGKQYTHLSNILPDGTYVDAWIEEEPEPEGGEKGVTLWRPATA